MSGGALLLVLGAVVASPIGRALDKGLTAHFIALNQRRADGGLSGFDVVECRLLYTALALGGMWVYPEGGNLHQRQRARPLARLRLHPEVAGHSAKPSIAAGRGKPTVYV